MYQVVSSSDVVMFHHHGYQLDNETWGRQADACHALAITFIYTILL